MAKIQIWQYANTANITPVLFQDGVFRGTPSAEYFLCVDIKIAAFNTPKINESQQTGLKNARIDVSCHVMCFVWS
jgi:hypothetical protein